MSQVTVPIHLGSELSSLTGLSEAEVRSQFEKDGFNELPKAGHRRFHHILIGIVAEPMVFLLIGCGLIYLFLGDAQEAMMLLGFLGIILGITLYQEGKAERALESLRDLSSPRALVLRGSQKKRVAGRELVRGDIIFLVEGDRVPADSELLSAHNLSVDESMLTGESVPVTKVPADQMTAQTVAYGLSSTVYAGTTTVRGSAVARVTRTGSLTKLGKIGKVLQTSTGGHTNLQLETGKLVTVIAGLAAGLCVVVILVYAVTRQDWLGGLLTGLTLAMAILPNELPAVLTIFLALGAWRLSQKRVLTRRTPAIEALGTATVLCVDKTGTLTFNRMVLRSLVAGNREYDLATNADKELPEFFHELVEYGVLAGEKDPFDPMDRALTEAAEHYLAKTEHLHPEWTLHRQYSLSPDLLALTHVWKTIDGKYFPVAAKGAPEAIVDLCHLNSQAAIEIAAQVDVLASKGLRVLGVAKSTLRASTPLENQHDYDFEFIGLVGFQDPLRPEVPAAVAQCRSAGVRVIMITGDHPETALSIAREIRLPNAESILTGKELSELSDEELKVRVKTVSVCARMAPEQKLRLVTALKDIGEVVAMTGDGVNDAPALKSAHIGIAMGQRGTDVARESASLVLLDDDFASIVASIKMGRRVYDNLQHAMAYLLAIHIPITGISILPVFFGLPVILMPVHIAFLHLIIEPACSIAFEAEPPDDNAMLRPPRGSNDKLFSGSFLSATLWQGFSVLVILLAVYLISLRRGQGEMDARTLTFTTLLVANIGLIFTNLSWTSASLRSHRPRNRAFWWICLGAISLLALVLAVPAIRGIFRFSALHPIDLGICLFAGLAASLWFEGLKFSRQRKNAPTPSPRR